MFMTLTLVAILNVFSPGNGHIPDRQYWSSLTCDEIYAGFVIELARSGGGIFNFECMEFAPIHEADLSLTVDWPADGNTE